jgi:hypothetical protein
MRKHASMTLVQLGSRSISPSSQHLQQNFLPSITIYIAMQRAADLLLYFLCCCAPNIHDPPTEAAETLLSGALTGLNLLKDIAAAASTPLLRELVGVSATIIQTIQVFSFILIVMLKMMVL